MADELSAVRDALRSPVEGPALRDIVTPGATSRDRRVRRHTASAASSDAHGGPGRDRRDSRPG